MTDIDTTTAVRASRRKFHVIYKTICLVTGRFYIGMHSTNDLEDGYKGSGQRLWKSIKKHGVDQHVCTILEHLPDRDALAKREEELVTPELLQDPLCMNLRTGGTGNPPGFITSSEVAAKISAKLKGIVRSPETREKMAAAKRNISFTNEHCAKLSVAKKGKPMKHRYDPSKACTIDGDKVYPSKAVLAAALGHGKSGARAPTFRYL